MNQKLIDYLIPILTIFISIKMLSLMKQQHEVGKRIKSWHQISLMKKGGDLHLFKNLQVQDPQKQCLQIQIHLPEMCIHFKVFMILMMSPCSCELQNVEKGTKDEE